MCLNLPLAVNKAFEDMLSQTAYGAYSPFKNINDDASSSSGAYRPVSQSPSDSEDNSKITRGWVYAALQLLILIILTGVVAVFYERGNLGDLSLIAMAAWSTTPFPCHGSHSEMEGKCFPAHTGQESLHHASDNNTSDCILNSNHQYYFYTAYGERGANTLCNLIGETPLYEREGVNLFSIMGIPFLLLSNQLIAAAFALVYVREDSLRNTILHNGISNSQKTLKNLALLLLTSYSISFIFIQTPWKLSGNNLFLVLIFVLFSFFLLVFQSASEFSELAKRQIIPLRLVEICLTISILTPAVLSAGGNTNVDDLLLSFFSVLLANAFFVVLELDKGHNHSFYSQDHSENNNKAYLLGGTQSIILLNAWLCLIPFIMHCALTLGEMEEGQNTFRAWAVVLLILYELLYALGVSLYNSILFSSMGRMKLDALLISYSWMFFKKEGQNERVAFYHCFANFLDILGVCGKLSISFVIMGGALATFSTTNNKSEHTPLMVTAAH